MARTLTTTRCAQFDCSNGILPIGRHFLHGSTAAEKLKACSKRAHACSSSISEVSSSLRLSQHLNYAPHGVSEAQVRGTCNAAKLQPKLRYMYMADDQTQLDCVS